MKILSTEEKRKKFIKKSIELWGYKYDYSKVDYVDNTTLVVIGYKGIWYKQTPNKHLQGRKIEFQVKRISNEEFIIKSKKVWGENRFNYSECEYLGGNKKIKLYDNEKNRWIEQVAKSHISGFEVLKFEMSEFIDKCNIVHSYNYQYDVNDYKSLNSLINIECNLHGWFKLKAASHLYGSCCSSCHRHLFNKNVIKFLKSRNINFETQKKFKECKNVYELPFTFFISSLRTCIELISNENNEKVKINDKIKSDYCEDNYIDLIRIRYDQIDSIEKILMDNLGNKIKILGRK